MKNLPYYGVRGPYNYPRRHSINGVGWKGDFTRVAGGTVILKNPEWFKATNSLTRMYRHNLKHGLPDGIDQHKPASYREYDEVMLYRICHAAGLKTPRVKNKDMFKHSISNVYRDIHLGDFGKPKRSDTRMKRVLADESCAKFLELERDPLWNELKTLVCKNEKIAQLLRRARKCAERRCNS
jgi:hypothetical protein